MARHLDSPERDALHRIALLAGRHVAPPRLAHATYKAADSPWLPVLEPAAGHVEEQLLWLVASGDQEACALVCYLPHVGFELRLTWNGELSHSQIYCDVDELLRASNAKRDELTGRGWHVVRVAASSVS